jgi:hypothetical protein
MTQQLSAQNHVLVFRAGIAANEPQYGCPHIKLLRSYDALDLDEGMIPNYIKALLNDRELWFVGEEIDELYTEVENVGERLEFIGIMDNEYLSYDPDEEA